MCSSIIRWTSRTETPATTAASDGVKLSIMAANSPCHRLYQNHPMHRKGLFTRGFPFSERSRRLRLTPNANQRWRSVHDQVSRAVWVIARSRYDQRLRLQDFAEFFAELCAEEAPIVPLRSSLLR